MNYRHAFHAGNFADVHKHIALLALIERFKRKPTPFFYLDTHAGRGWYDLRSAEASRGDEWQAGIGRIRDISPQCEDIRRYLAAIKAATTRSPSETAYPGSPILSMKNLREGDRAVFVEKQLEEAYALQQYARGRRGVSIVHGDGYASLKTYLPPREQRGLVLIDPPYESDREYSEIVRALVWGLQRWPGGVFAIWYPIKAGPDVQRLHAALKSSSMRKLLSLRLSVRPASSPLGLNGSGILVANPPWQFDQEMHLTMQELHRTLAPAGAGDAEVEWLVPE